MKTNLVVIGVALFAIVVSNGLTHSVMRKEVEKVKVERDSTINSLYEIHFNASEFYTEAIYSAINEDLDGTDYNMSKAFQADSAFLEIYVASF